MPEIESSAGLSAERVEQVFECILRGEWTPVQVAGLAIALRLRGINAEVIAAAARALRKSMQAVEHNYQAVLDTCGTGGDGRGSLNLSTAAAFVAAADGVPRSQAW